MNDTPKMFMKHPTNKSHVILVNDPDDPGNTIIILIHILGVANAFTVRTPSEEEFDNKDIPHLIMTGKSLDWEPYEKDWAEQEAAMTNCRGHIQGQECNDIVTRGWRIINSVSYNYLSVDITDNQDFTQELERHVQVCRVKTSGGWRAIDADALAEKQMVSPDIAQQTLAHTTRHGFCMLANSTLLRCLSSNG